MHCLLNSSSIYNQDTIATFHPGGQTWSFGVKVHCTLKSHSDLVLRCNKYIPELLIIFSNTLTAIFLNIELYRQSHRKEGDLWSAGIQQPGKISFPCVEKLLQYWLLLKGYSKVFWVHMNLLKLKIENHLGWLMSDHPKGVLRNRVELKASHLVSNKQYIRTYWSYSSCL